MASPTRLGWAEREALAAINKAEWNLAKRLLHLRLQPRRGGSVGHVRKKHGLSERRTCRLLGFWRGTMRYQSQRRVASELLEDLRQVAMERPRFGYRRLHVMLRRKGWSVNKKLVLRLVRENGWLVRRRQRKKLAAVPRVAVPQPTRPNQDRC